MTETIQDHPTDTDRNSLGQFKAGNSRKAVAITPDTARDMQQRSVDSRRTNQRKANDQAMVTAIEHDQGIEELTSEQGAALIVAKQTIKAISPDQGLCWWGDFFGMSFYLTLRKRLRFEYTKMSNTAWRIYFGPVYLGWFFI